MVALDQLLQLSEQLRDVTDSSLQGVAQQKTRKSNTAFVYQPPVPISPVIIMVHQSGP